jgi:hypothetical protein
MMDLVTEANAVLREIVSERIYQELPGETATQRFARRVAIASPLAPHQSVGAQQSPLSIPISPEAVEPVISVWRVRK